MSEQMLELSSIRIDGDTQPRLAIDQAVVAEYVEAMEAGAQFPPVQVVSDGAANWLVDGFHRFYANRKLGRKQIKAEVTTGLQAEAQWMSLTANKTHGLRRTNQDKAKAVIKALKMRPELSDGAIAEHVGVHLNTVLKYRKAFEDRATYTKCVSRVGRDGRTVSTEKIGQASTTRRGKPSISSKAFTPIRGHSKPSPMTALSMPHDPVMGARTLIELFKPEYLRVLITHLSEHLKGIVQ